MNNFMPSAKPWKLVTKKKQEWRIYADDGYDIVVSSFDDEYGRPVEDACNLRLMSASPEMLEALEMVSAWYVMNDGTDKNHKRLGQIIRKYINPAIKKARGENV